MAIVMETIAVLIAVHNRLATTLACLEQLYTQPLEPGVQLRVFLVDDGSTDGTTQAIQQQYPQVDLLQGNGHLFWGGAMRLAFQTAMNQGFSHYLWLNDDTHLHPGALQRLLNCSRQEGPHSVVVGSVQDPQTFQLTYGGLHAPRGKVWQMEVIQPTSDVQTAGSMHGNCVLIPDQVARKVGVIDHRFPHRLGDVDYGLRVIKAGYTIKVVPQFVGYCANNPVTASWFGAQHAWQSRWKAISQIRGLPLIPYAQFCHRHYGYLWWLYWIWPYLYALLGRSPRQLLRRRSR